MGGATNAAGGVAGAASQGGAFLGMIDKLKTGISDNLQAGAKSIGITPNKDLWAKAGSLIQSLNDPNRQEGVISALAKMGPPPQIPMGQMQNPLGQELTNTGSSLQPIQPQPIGGVGQQLIRRY